MNIEAYEYRKDTHMGTSFYSVDELMSLGINFNNTYGGGIESVQISRKCSFYNASKITVGDHVRIDDFCILSGNITLGSYIHIAAYSAIFSGEAGVVMEDFSGMSSRCVIYAESDDYSGNYLTNPTVPAEYLNIHKEKVILHRHVILGIGTSVLPGVEIGEGTSVGSMSLVNKSLDPWSIYVGIPCRKIKERNQNLLLLEKKLLEAE